VSKVQEILLNSSNVHDVERVDGEGEKSAATFACKSLRKNRKVWNGEQNV